MTNAMQDQAHADEQTGKTISGRYVSGTWIKGSIPSRPADKATIPPTASNKRILIVDDELFILEILEIMLSRMGYWVDTTTSSENALVMLDDTAGSYHLILADLTMPQMTGLQLARQIRRRHPGIPMILITGLDIDGPDQPDEISLFDAVLTKPVPFADLAEVVRQILE